MKARYLEVTYRKGKPLAAYLYLPRKPGAKSVRTERATDRILVDFDDGDRPMGLEITDPDGLTVDEINGVLQRFGQMKIAPEELAPLWLFRVSSGCGEVAHRRSPYGANDQFQLQVSAETSHGRKRGGHAP